MPYALIADTARARSAATMLLLALAATSAHAHAQPVRVPPAPPSPATPPTPATPATPVTPRAAPTPMALPYPALAGTFNSDLWRMEVEQQARVMSTRAMELQSLRYTTLGAARAEAHQTLETRLHIGGQRGGVSSDAGSLHKAGRGREPWN